MADCATCGFESSRLIGGLEECDACWKYRKRHNGKPRPARLSARSGTLRVNRHQTTVELQILRANNWPEPHTHDHYDGHYALYPDGIQRPVLRTPSDAPHPPTRQPDTPPHE